MRLLAMILALGTAFAQAPAGKTAYLSRCAGCHGEDGSGGGHGPGILKNTQSLDTVAELIRKGIPNTGMPAFDLPLPERQSIARFVLSLRGVAPRANAPIGTDAEASAGERFFHGEGKCAGCHMLRGRGGILGPDLSNIGAERTVAQLEEALRNPGARKFRAVSVELKSGTQLRGIAKNESPFDLQLLSTDGRLRLLRKAHVAKVTDEKSLMPALPAPPQALLAYLTRQTASGPRLSTGPLGPGVSFSEIAAPPPGSWPSYNGALSGNRYSALAQIDTTNVQRLAPAWMFPIPNAPGALQTTPVVADGIMYVTSVNEVFALDAASGRPIWHFLRPRTPGLAGDAAGGINRGVALLGDRVFLATDNAHLLALHRLTGQVIWEVEMADHRQNYGATGAPLIVGDLVIAGISGGDEGVRGFLDAYKASTGERAWRFWTIPARGEPGSETWGGRDIEHGCGATWLTGTFDPETNLLYWPTGNPCADYNGDERKGDNLYTSSVVALDPRTGKLRWHYQFTPHDLHDWDATEPPVLIDATFQGQPRKLLLQGNRNGFFYVLDRVTGKVLLAKPFVQKLTWASGIGDDGRPVLLPGNDPTAEGQRTCPSVAGAANWTSTAYSPRTNLYYLFAQESCNIYSKRAENWQAGQSYYGGATRRSPADGDGKFLRALDIQTGRIAWEIPNIGGGILGSGLMATAGNLLFYGDDRGAFVAADATNGRLLWHFNTAHRWKGGPMTYTVDGRQHVAIAAGSTILSFRLR